MKRLAAVLLLAASTALAQISPQVGLVREDSAHADGAWGVFGLVVRKDVAAAICGTDGDYCPLQVNDEGSLRVEITNFQVSVNTEAGTSNLNDSTSNPSSALDVGAFQLVWDSISWQRAPGDVINGQDVDVTRLPNEGQQTMANSISVALASNQSAVVVDSELPAAGALADNTATPSIPSAGSFLMAFDGTNWDRVQTGAGTGGALKVDGSAVTQPVSGTVAVTGVATSANQTTEITALQLIDNLPNTIGSTTAGQSGALAFGAVTTAAPTYTTAQSNPLSLQTDGSLRVAVTAGGGGGTQYAEDSSHVSTDTLTLAGVVQQSADAALSSDGDRSLLQVDANGFLKVNIKAGAGSGGTAAADDGPFTLGTTQVTVAGCVEATDSMDAGDLGGIKCGADRELDIDVVSSVLPTGAATSAEQATQTASLSVLDDWDDGSDRARVVGAAAHDAAVAGNPILIAGRSSAAAPTDVSADGEAVSAWHLRNGAEAVVLTAAGALIGGDATNGLDVDVVRLPALVAGTANIGDVDVLTLPAIPAGNNNIGDVDVATIAAGNNNIGDVDVASLPSVTIGTFPDNEPFNVAQINGVTTAVNSGDASTGTQRVVTAQNLVSSANNDGACVNVSTTTTVLASFSTRKWATIQNRGTQIVYIKFGATATSSDFPVDPGGVFNWPSGLSYTGVVDAIAASGTQSVCVAEW